MKGELHLKIKDLQNIQLTESLGYKQLPEFHSIAAKTAEEKIISSEAVG